ncbi:MAG: motility associated factor glycosyltransferase family protein [Gammaproteobacteria bacterium]|nr:motility associated factor glycosyltransferase family protein [Gammaproteobacteria bacterium]
MSSLSVEFEEILSQLSLANLNKLEATLLANAKNNLPYCDKKLDHLRALLPPQKQESAIIISAGPSIHRRKSIQCILDSSYEGCIIAVDAAYVACLRAGLIPDFVVSLDSHATRMVRWFGDPNLAENTKNDDYFKRQDLDVEFRKNAETKNQQNIELVNRYGHLTRGIVSSSIPSNVLDRLLQAKMDLFWWNPLVDDPYSENSLTKRLFEINQLSALNTGGNVGTSAWVFATDVLTIPHIAMVGMDLGYYADTPYTMTQTYPQIVQYNESPDQLDKYFVNYQFPLTQEKFYTDVTYYWYRRNFLELLQQSKSRTVNCTEGGILFDDRLPCIFLKDFLNG